MTSLSSLSSQTIITSSQTTTDQTAAEAAAEDAEQQKIDFLDILVTQLENQNPLDPMDTDEWTAQLTRYSMLEQNIETNEQLVIANDLLASSAATDLISYIGEDVEISTNISVVQDGEAAWAYSVEGDADEVILSVVDENGDSVYETTGSTVTGVHDFTLDSTLAELSEGSQLYLSINAKDADGNQLNAETTSYVTVDGVWTDDTATYLTAGSVSFRSSDILKLINTQTTSTEE